MLPSKDPLQVHDIISLEQFQWLLLQSIQIYIAPLRSLLRGAPDPVKAVRTVFLLNSNDTISVLTSSADFGGEHPGNVSLIIQKGICVHRLLQFFAQHQYFRPLIFFTSLRQFPYYMPKKACILCILCRPTAYVVFKTRRPHIELFTKLQLVFAKISMSCYDNRLDEAHGENS